MSVFDRLLVQMGARGGSGTTLAYQYVTTAAGIAGTKLDTLAAENATPVVDNTTAVTLDFDEATGGALGFGVFYGFTIPLLGTDGQALTWDRTKGALRAGVMVEDEPIANILPCVLLHEAEDLTTADMDCVGAGLQMDTNWEAQALRKTGAGSLTQRSATANDAAIYGAMVHLTPRSGTGNSVQAQALDNTGTIINTSNIGTVDDNSTIASLAWMSFGVFLLGASTDTIRMSAAVWAEDTALGALP